MIASRPPKKDEELDRRTIGNFLFVCDLLVIGCITSALAGLIELLSKFG